MFISILISTLQLLGLYKDMHPNTNPWLLAGLDRFKPQNCKALEWSQHGHQNLPLSSRKFVFFCWAKHPHELWNLLGVSKIWAESTCPWIKPWFWQSKKNHFVYPYPTKNQGKPMGSWQKLSQLSKSHSSKMIKKGGTLGWNYYCNMQQIIYCKYFAFFYVWFQ